MTPRSPEPTVPNSRPLSVYARFLALAVVFLLAAGAMVTSTGSGLAVPDWPLSFGQVMPPMEGGVFYEHGHRMVATAVGALTVILALWIQRTDPRRWVRRLGWIAVGMVVVQGLFGGATVLLKLPVWTSAIHACLAQGFFLMTVFLALVLSPAWPERGPVLPGESRLPTLALLTTVLVYGQLILGALVRHLHAALVIPDFPLVYGGWIPPRWTPEIAAHYTHRVGALAIAVAAAATAVSAFRLGPGYGGLKRPAAILVGLVLVQILLGGSIVWTQRQVHVATTHVVVGAILLASGFVLTVRTRRARPRSIPAAAVRDASPAMKTGRVPA